MKPTPDNELGPVAEPSPSSVAARRTASSPPVAPLPARRRASAWLLLAPALVALGCGGGAPAPAGGEHAAAGAGPASRPSAGGAPFAVEETARALPVPEGTTTSMHPDAVVSSSGAVYVLVAGGSLAGVGLDLLISHDGGDGFAPPVPVTPPADGVVSHGENGPRLAVTGTEIHALWEQPAAGGINRLVHARSVDFGRSFLPPQPVGSKPAPSFNGFANMAVNRAGDVHVAWLDGRDPDRDMETFDLYVATSRDRGASFANDVRVGASACPCCRPAIAFGPDDTVHVAWRQVFAGDVRDIVVSSSRDGGRSFEEPVRVAVDGWSLVACPHSGPAVASVGERLWVTWFTAGGEAPPGIRLSVSDDGGRTFAPPVTVSGGVLDANHPDLLAAESGGVLLVFQGRDPAGPSGWGPLVPWIVDVTDPGAPSEPVPLPATHSVSYPALAAGPSGQALVTWTESPGGRPVAMMARARAIERGIGK